MCQGKKEEKKEGRKTREIGKKWEEIILKRVRILKFVHSATKRKNRGLTL